MSGSGALPARLPTPKSAIRERLIDRGADAARAAKNFATLPAFAKGDLSMTEIHDLSAHELLRRYRAKSLSPTEAFAAVERHVARWEPHIKALYAYDPEGARTAAAASTQRWAKGSPVGPLDGV